MARPHWANGRARMAMNARQVQLARYLVELVQRGPDLKGAKCAEIGPEFWFPEKGAHGHEEKQAAALCAQCPVRRACLEDALNAGAELTHYGVWAGYTYKRLSRMRVLLKLIRDCAPPKQGVGSKQTDHPEEEHHDAA